MKKIVSLFLSCILWLGVTACSESTPTPKADVESIREYACKLANHIHEFNSHVESFVTANRDHAAALCREMELGYRRLKAEDCPPELTLARNHVLGEIRKYLDGAWDWAAIEEKDEKFKGKLKDDISPDVNTIREHSVVLVGFIDEFYQYVMNFDVKPRSDAPGLCEGMELGYHEFQSVVLSSQLSGAQGRVLERVRTYLDKAWDWTVSEEGDEVKRQYKSDIFEWEAVPAPECRVTPTP